MLDVSFTLTFVFYCWASRVALVLKNTPANARDIKDTGSIPGSGRSPGEGKGNPLQYSYLGKPIDGGLQNMGWKKESNMT